MARSRRPLAILTAAMALAFVGGAVFIVVTQQTGEKTQARVTDCERPPGRRTTSVCRGTWVAGGSLLEDGRVVLGTIEGATSSDVGRTIEVRVSGDRAYTTSLRLPIVLALAGVAVAVLGGVELRRQGRRGLKP